MQKFQLKQIFEIFLDDPGIQLTHRQKEKIVLEDIFIFPELSHDIEGVINSKELLKINERENRIIISGTEDSGKTTLVKVLIKHYLDCGYYPVYIDTPNINLEDPGEMLDIIENKYEELYQNESYEIIKAEPSGKKAIFIDNFDKIGNDPGFQLSLLENLYSKFANVILTVGAQYNIIRSDIFSPELSRDVKRHEIMEFSNELRLDLIHRWNKIGSSKETEIETTSLRAEKTKKIFDTVIGHNLVPSYPVFLLTILQITHEDEADILSGSSYGQYYEYMILKSLGKSVEKEELDYYLDYLSKLSYHMFRKNDPTITARELSSFYKGQLSNTPDLITHTGIIEALIRADTIIAEQSLYRFKYKYIYYYFVARYLSSNMNLESVKDDIKLLCRELHNDDYANIVLFLTHHTKDPRIIDEILTSTKSIFSDMDPFSMEEDSLEIDELIEELSRLGTKDRKLKELIAQYPSRDTERVIHHITNEDDQFEEERKSIVVQIDIEEFSAASNALKIVGQITNSTGTKETNIATLIRETYKMALRTLNAYKSILDQNKETITKVYSDRFQNVVSVEDLSQQILIKEEIYSGYEKIFILFLRQTALSIGNSITYDNLNDKMPDSMMKALFLIASTTAGKESFITLKEIKNIISVVTDNKFATELLKRILSFCIYIKNIDSEDEKNIREIIDINNKTGTRHYLEF